MIIDGMELYKRMKELRDQGAPMLTLDSLTPMTLDGTEVLSNWHGPDPWVPPDGSLEAYWSVEL